MAEAVFNQDLAYRRWNAARGGVYAFESAQTPFNPYLPASVERRLTTDDGRTLVMINPAYMTRQVHEMPESLASIRGHITSLKPIRPANAPLAWERDALLSFQAGASLYTALVEEANGASALRFMRPLLTEQRCLQCHQEQGYQVGDIRGGISVTVPFAPYEAHAAAQMARLTNVHLAFWVMGVVGILFSQRKMRHSINTEFQLQQRLTSVLKGTGAGMWEWAVESDRMVLNDQWVESIGYRHEDLGETTMAAWRTLCHAEDLQANQPHIDAVMAGETPNLSLRLRLRHRNGQWRWVWVRGQVNHTSPTGQALHLAGTFVDISEIEQKTAALQASHQQLSRREQALAEANLALAQERDRANELAQLAERSSQAKSQFLSMMSHEIRTPLHTVLGMNSLLMMGQLPDQERGYAETIRLSGRALLSVINDILDFSKIESSLLELENEPFQPKLCALEAAKIIESTALEKDIRLVFDAGSLPHLTLRGDAGRYRQILLNLLSNAVKFTPPQGRVEMRMWQQPIAHQPHRQHVFVAVEDTGIGLSESMMSRIFEPFTQSDSSVSRKFGGTGLGLSIARRLARMMQGDLTCANRNHGGAVFELSIGGDVVASSPQVERPRGPGSSSSSAAAGQPQARPLSGSILVVDDCNINQALACQFLERMGLESESVSSAQELIQREGVDAFDLILMDIQMPETDGIEATELLLRTHPADTLPPIIGLSAMADKETRQAALAAGMSHFVAKPVSFLELRDVLQRYLPPQASKPATTPPAVA